MTTLANGRRWVGTKNYWTSWSKENGWLKVDYEKTVDAAKAFVYLAMILNLINKAARTKIK